MVVLASASPRRKELLSLLGVDFVVEPADVDETLPDGIHSPKEAVEYLSKIKGYAIGEKDGIVISADTVVAFDGKILGKPKDSEQAVEMLTMLSGQIHSVFTGVTVVGNGKTVTFSVETKVEFYELSFDQIKNYVDSGEPMDKAGAYGIQGKGSLLVKGIHGDYFNVVGLPISRLARVLDKISHE